MKSHILHLYELLRSQRGQAMPEYAVIAGAIIVAAYAVFRTVGTDVNALVQSILVAL
jgi:Flp pilus assembly pilin Flp